MSYRSQLCVCIITLQINCFVYKVSHYTGKQRLTRQEPLLSDVKNEIHLEVVRT